MPPTLTHCCLPADPAYRLPAAHLCRISKEQAASLLNEAAGTKPSFFDDPTSEFATISPEQDAPPHILLTLARSDGNVTRLRPTTLLLQAKRVIASLYL